jgi:glucans biosynthesis protein
MTSPLTRRDVVRVAALAALAGTPLGRQAGAQSGEDRLHYGPPEPFSFERLIERAREMSKGPYSPPSRPNPEIVQRIDYDAYGKIVSDPDYALYANGPGVYPILLKHVGMFFPKTVRMHSVSDGMAREILYSPSYFELPADHVARGLPEQPSAFAGFWIQESRLSHDPFKEEPWATFLGASYFRAVGELGQVGQSARGLAIGTGDPGPEEFPDFVEHWFQPALAESEPVVVHSLLDGPSIAGAYRFEIRRTRGVVMTIDARLFPRREIPHIGIGPLTSMFWFGEYGKQLNEDWRPEVHDADGLAIWNGNGEHLWRPLNNPKRIVTSSFFDTNPKGFGLSQRDRNYDHYLEGVRYHLRPDTWVEPLNPWGRGSVQLVEIPTNDEIYDNIVAFWTPETPPKAGDELTYQYRLHWLAEEPFFPKDRLAKVFQMGIGRGGQPGRDRLPGVHKFMVDFAGGPLVGLPSDAILKPEIGTSVGTIGLIHVEQTPFTDRWRVTFDLDAPAGEVAELRMLFTMDGRPITETWLYQFHVPPRPA